VRQARRLYTPGEPVPWPDVNLPARWHLNSRRGLVPPVPREGPERVKEIHMLRALLPMDLRRDPAFAIASPKWDTFSAWEWRPEQRASYLGDVDWDRQWAPEASSDDDDNEEEDEDEGGVGVQAEQPPPPPPDLQRPGGLRRHR
jgi:hypothetical protein